MVYFLWKITSHEFLLCWRKFFVDERNETLLANLQMAKKLIHTFTALDREQMQIQASYQEINQKYQKIWKTGTPFLLKIFLVFLFTAILYFLLYAPSYKYFALYVVTRTFLEQKVYFPFFIVFAISISYALVMLIQFFHNKSAFKTNDTIAHKNTDILAKNYELSLRENQVVEQINSIKRQYAETCSAWYPSGYTSDYQVDYFVKVVGTGEAKTIAEACNMLREQQRYDEQMQLKKDQFKEQMRHNQQQEKNQIFDSVVRGVSTMAVAGAMNNQADATRNQHVHVTHTHY